MVFEIIEGGKAAEEKKREVRRNIRVEAFRRMFRQKSTFFSTREELKAAIFCGVKYISMAPLSGAGADSRVLLRDVANLEMRMQFLTPNEMLEIFPLGKDFDGQRYGMKDYFSAKECISKYDGNSSMLDNMDDILMEYWNSDIINYQVKKFMLADSIRREEGKKSMMEEFAEAMDITTYTYDEEEGKMYDRKTGKAIQVKKPIPRNWAIYT